MSLVLSRKVGSASRKTVLLVMADAANPDGSRVFLSKPSIARRAEISVDTVKRNIKAFLAEGILELTGKHKITNGFTQEYCINLNVVTDLESSKKPNQSYIVHNALGASCPSDPPAIRTLTGGHGAPQTVLEPSLNHPLPTRGQGSRLKSELPRKEFVATVSARWNSMATQNGFASLSKILPSRLQLIQKRLSECDGDEEEVLAVIDRVPLMEGWLGGGKREHITFDWVFGSPKLQKPDRFLEAREYNPRSAHIKRNHHGSNNSNPRRHQKSDALDTAARIALERFNSRADAKIYWQQ